MSSSEGEPEGFEDWLQEIDSRLEGVEEERALAAQARLEQGKRRYFELSSWIDKIMPRLEHARTLQAEGIARELQTRLETMEREREGLLAELGFDPVAELEEQERLEAERRKKLSGDEKSCLLESLGSADAPQARAAWRRAMDGCELLLVSDLRDIFDRVLTVLAENGESCSRFREEVREALGFELEEEDPGRAQELLEAYCEQQRRLARERREAARELHAIHQEAVTLETEAGSLPVAAIEAKIHELCCRAKLLQRYSGSQLRPEQDDLLHYEVFGRLGSIRKECNCGYVPSLKTEWMPPSLPEEIAGARREYEEQLRSAAEQEPDAGAAAAPASEELSREIHRLRQKCGQAEHWLLAEVYRAVTEFLNAPQDEGAASSLRACARQALEFLSLHREQLPGILLDARGCFDEGAEFRWLRKRFGKLTELAAAETAGEDAREEGEDKEEAELPPEVTTPSGETCIHPSIRRARRISKGARLLVLGGSGGKEGKAERLRESLEAASVDWVAHERGDGMRLTQQTAAKIENGSYDCVVLLLGRMSHKTSAPILDACKSRSVPVAKVFRGCGEVRIAEELGRLFPASARHERPAGAGQG